MNMGQKIHGLREGTEISGESNYIVEMGDGTGTKRVKHKTLVGQIQKDMELSYEETMDLLNGEEPEETEDSGNGNQDNTESEEI